MTLLANPSRFVRFELRTTQVDAARSFYASLLGEACPDITPLPAAAAAAGAPAHWLGHLDVDDVERAADAFVARGAVRLGPTRATPDGRAIAVVRDPGGAGLALEARPLPPARCDVVWHQLHTRDLERATQNYCELFGWQPTERVDLGAFGLQQRFAWSEGGGSVGAIANVAGRPDVHTHWLFYFQVAALEPALALVRGAGGLVIGPMQLPDGARIAVCEDPQGAAFGLMALSARSARPAES